MNFLDIGLFINLFEIKLSSNKINVVCCSRNKHQNVNELREKFKEDNINVSLISSNENIFGYGKDIEKLLKYDFNTKEVDLFEEPQLTKNLITESLIDFLKTIGFTVIDTKFELLVKRMQKKIELIPSELFLVKCFKLKISYLFNHETKKLCYILSIDTLVSTIDNKNNRLNYHDLKIKYGSDVFYKIKEIQKEYLPNRKINLEISKLKLLDEILPFVNTLNYFCIDDNITAEVISNPLRIVLGG